MLSSIHKVVEHQDEIDRLEINLIWFNDINERVVWLIIWKIRERIFDLSIEWKNIECKSIQDIIIVIKLAIHIDKDFSSIEDLSSYILGLKFQNIEGLFLNNEIQKKDFLLWIKKFLSSTPNIKFSDRIISKK